MRYLNDNSLSLGVYALGAGAIDTQPAHTEDELYYVLSGEANLDVDGDMLPVSAGSLVYVRAGISHRFIDISADLQVLVFFTKGETDRESQPWLAFHLDELLAEESETAQMAPFLDVSGMAAQLVRLPVRSGQAAALDGKQEMIYLILQGGGTVMVGDRTARGTPGALLLVPAGSRPEFDTSTGELVLLIFRVKG